MYDNIIINIGREETAVIKERGAFIMESIKYGICPFCASTGTAVSSDMVQCDTCSKWYHTTCVGIDVQHFDEQTRFCCCENQEQDNYFEYVFLFAITGVSHY